MTELLLAGDVGGTKTRLAAFQRNANGSLERKQTKQYRSAEYPNLQNIISLFLAEHDLGGLARGCIGVPGPVSNGVVKITNLPWELSESEIESATGLKRMLLVNDLFATAAAVPYLTKDDLSTVVAGQEPTKEGMAAVIAPGTGLGMGFVLRSAKGDRVIASEGGHARFAPADALEAELLNFLVKRAPYVCVENVLCGPGIKNIFDFLASRSPAQVSDSLRNEISLAPDAAAVISQKALANQDQICRQTLEIFLSILGSHCGNIAVTAVTTCGIFLGGGIPPKIAPLLSSPILRERFLERGKMTHLVKDMSIFLIKDDYAALTGAASLAFNE